MEKTDAQTELPPITAPAAAVAHADIAAAPIIPPDSMTKKRANFTSRALSRLLLSLLLQRHGVLLLVPLVYFSGMLLFMRDGGDGGNLSQVPSTPSLPSTLHDFSIFDVSPCSPSAASPPTQGSYISYAWGLDILRLRDVTSERIYKRTNLAMGED